ncbi:MAG: D-alanyl-D-alanine carboxypeptidase [Actinobacteria bacterium]|nr:D-alanyl-D-alanine carboxypeptidase [Actinomycetota bacterium]
MLALLSAAAPLGATAAAARQSSGTGPPTESPLVTLPSGGRAPPAIHAPEAIAVDERTGMPLFEKHSAARRPIASTTKLMTAYIALRTTRPDQVFVAQRYPASPGESTLGLEPGERMTAGDLLDALLLASANDAAATLAHGIAGSEAAFVARMNAEAGRLGLRDTRYANPIGLDDPNGYSSARDLATLARKLMDDPRFRAIVGRRQARLESGAHPRKIVNRNDLVGAYRFVDGVKTGHTSGAGWVLVGAGRRHGASVISVVMGEPSQADRDSETLSLLRYGLRRYAHVSVRASRTVKLVMVKDYTARAPLRPGRDLDAEVLRGSSVTLRVYAPPIVRGPIPPGGRVGEVALAADGRQVAEAPLVAAEPVPGTSFGRRLVIKLSNGDATLGAGVLAAAVILAMRLSRSAMLTRRRSGA